MSRIESGKMDLEHAAFSVDALLCDIESMLTTDAERRKIHFHVESDLRGEVYLGDNIRLRQVILNLLSNAFKFTPEGGTVRLCVEGDSDTDTERTLTVKVIDTGVGVSSENQQRIFRSCLLYTSWAMAQTCRIPYTQLRPSAARPITLSPSRITRRYWIG